MTPRLPYILLSVGVLLIATIICKPGWISDDNAFLRDFVSEYFLSVLGVILAISVPSMAQIHLSLNRIEESRGIESFQEVRAEINGLPNV